MKQVMLNSAKRRGKKINFEDLNNKLGEVAKLFDEQSDSFFTSGRLLDDGMIDPRDTRKIIAFCLTTAIEARKRTLKPNSFGIARF